MESIIVSPGSKEEKYRTLIPQVRALLEGETDMVARMANAAAAIQETFGFLWTGFYRVVKKPGRPDSNVEASERTDVGAGQADLGSHTKSCELAVGPFQGPVACSRIAFGKGVCGSAWKEARTLVVPDVELFPGHIRCSSAARSEIVVPMFRNIGTMENSISSDTGNSPDTGAACTSRSDKGNTYPKHTGTEGSTESSWQDVTAVLDIDSASPGTFDGTDAIYLEKICGIVGNYLLPSV